MDLRKGEKSLQVFQIFKRIQHTAALALGTHLSQKPREHLHLHAETVPSSLITIMTLSSAEPFIQRDTVAPAEAGPAHLPPPWRLVFLQGERGSSSIGGGLKRTREHCKFHFQRQL